MDSVSLSYILNELGEDRRGHYGAVTPPMYQTSNFCFPTVDAMRQSLAYESKIPFYTRGCNPTVEILRRKIAALEGAEDAWVFGSGSAAIAAAVISVLSAGDHVVSVAKPYSWTNTLLNTLLKRFGVTTTMIDGTDILNWESAIRPETRLFFMESPNSMTFELQDIAAVTALAKQRGITTICDNSYNSPLNQSPIAMGVDMVCHSATKYLNGHSDVVAGVVCGSKEMMQRIFDGEFMTLGGILSPHDAWLLIRGLRTLEVRVQRSSASTEQIVAWLEQHPKVQQVIWPFSPSFPQYELARRQMKGATGLFSVLLKAPDIAAMERFSNQLRYFLLACSWGGYESLQFPICTLYTSQNYSKTTLPWNMVRLAVGLEDPNELIRDLSQALDLI